MATGVLTIGNSGVGKSLLDNIILGREAFVHDMCPGSVTSRTEEAIVNTGVPEWGAVKVFNIPGLIEADPAKIARNKTELNRAFESCDQQVSVLS